MKRIAMMRRGGTLVELLIALPMAALLAVAAAATLIGSWRLVRHAGSSQGATRELRHAQAAFEAELRPLRAPDIIALSDTAIEFDALLGVGVVCAAVTASSSGVADRIDMASADPADPRGASWASGIQIGDELSLWRAGLDSIGSLSEVRTSVRDIAWGSACAAAPWLAGWSDRRTVRITLANPSLSPIVVGTAVAARRRTRLSLYRSGATWYVGKRTRSGGSWDIVQPVAGPFLSAAQGGMTARLLDAAGATTRAIADVAAVRIELRADRAPDGAASTRRDTASFDVVLRGESAHRRR